MTENLIPVQFPDVKEANETADGGAVAPRRVFVEPEVSFPIDVLESTTFFQSAETGTPVPPTE